MDNIIGNLYKEIYMELPHGYLLPHNTRKVCRLGKSLYDLK